MNAANKQLPPDNLTRLCVTCWTSGTRRPATQLTPNTGHAVCDEHANLTEIEVKTAIHNARHQ